MSFDIQSSGGEYHYVPVCRLDAAGCFNTHFGLIPTEPKHMARTFFQNLAWKNRLSFCVKNLKPRSVFKDPMSM